MGFVHMVKTKEIVAKPFICPACHKELSDQWVEGRINFLCKNDDCYVYDVVVHRTVRSYIDG